ncbi:MAG: RecX family transcriptional regulator [Bacillota bacterium]|nr:RecX family transcriptional regulator [Bacillota bacterium]MDW7684613.1 RecX family transcriptional regulator [Bacillota bacterium]
MNEGMTLKRARSAAYKMLAARARSRSQVFEALRRKGADEETAATVLTELQEAGYVDDREYAKQAVRANIEKKPCGPHYLRAVLARAGIARELTEEIILETIPPENEYALAVEFVRTLVRRGETSPAKAMRKLANRGFSATVIHRAVEEEFCKNLDIMS